eukprot:IDg13695t1
MDGNQKLQDLSLINKICLELENHLGIEGVSARELAEFLIYKAKENEDFENFVSAITELNGAPLPRALLTSAHRSVIALNPKEKLSKNHSSRTARRPRFADAASIPLAFGTEPSRAITESIITESKEGFLGSGIDREKLIRETEAENQAQLSERHDKAARSNQNRHNSGTDSRPQPILYPEEKDIRPGAIVRGRVTSVKAFGAFVSLVPRSTRAKEGLIHISRLPSTGKAQHPSDLLSRGNSAWVKVLAVAGGKIDLCMRDIDQKTGEDRGQREAGPSRVSRRPRNEEQERFREERRQYRSFNSNQESVSGIPRSFVRDDFNGRRKEGERMKRSLAANEQWELTQLAKILPQKELRKQIGFDLRNPSPADPLDEDEDSQVVLIGENDEMVEETEIELNEDEPAFLRLSDDNVGIRAQPLSPVRIVKNPDGSMQRAAMTQSALAKERRELRDQQRAAAENEMPVDLNRAWEDPMSKERHVAAELRGVTAGPMEIPDWKKKAMGAAPSFGLQSQWTR